MAIAKRTSIYLDPVLAELAAARSEPYSEILYRGLLVKPLLIEEKDGFTDHWYCAVPPEGAKFRVLRQHWTGKQPIREIYEVEVTQNSPS